MTPEQMKIEDERHLKALERIREELHQIAVEMHVIADSPNQVPEHQFSDEWRERGTRDFQALMATRPLDYFAPEEECD